MSPPPRPHMSPYDSLICFDCTLDALKYVDTGRPHCSRMISCPFSPEFLTISSTMALVRASCQTRALLSGSRVFPIIKFTAEKNQTFGKVSLSGQVIFSLISLRLITIS